MLLPQPSKTLLTALGDFWTDYFKDSEILASITTGATALYSTEYSKLLDYVLASSLLEIPVNERISYALMAFSESKCEPTESGFRAELSSDILNIDYLVSTFFEPNVVLTQGVDYEVIDNYLYFYVDIFNDDAIFTDAYTVDTYEGKVVLLWASNNVIKDDLIYQRYGWHVYSPEFDSEHYRWIVTALIYFYANTKSVKRIETVVNTLFGLPFSRYSGEVVQSINYVDNEGNIVANAGFASYIQISTDKSQYLTYIFTELLVTEGQILKDYELLARFTIVEDYLTNPTWYDGIHFPFKLLKDYRHPDFLSWCESNPEYSEYPKYINEQYDSNIDFDTSRYYVGNLSVWETYPGKNPLIELACSSSSSGFQADLYNILDNVLKYNLIHFNLELDFENYFLYNQIKDQLPDLIQSGLPVYLYPFLETIFRADFYDAFDIQANEYTHDLTLANKTDRYYPCEFKLYNEYHNYNEFNVVEEFYFDSALLYSGNTDYNFNRDFDFHFFYDCETELTDLNLISRVDDIYNFTSIFEYSLIYRGYEHYTGSESYNQVLVEVENDYQNSIDTDILLHDVKEDTEDIFNNSDVELQSLDNYVNGYAYNNNFNYNNIFYSASYYNNVYEIISYYNSGNTYCSEINYEPQEVHNDTYNASLDYQIEVNIPNKYSSYKYIDTENLSLIQELQDEVDLPTDNDFVIDYNNDAFYAGQIIYKNVYSYDLSLSADFFDLNTEIEEQSSETTADINYQDGVPAHNYAGLKTYDPYSYYEYNSSYGYNNINYRLFDGNFYYSGSEVYETVISSDLCYEGVNKLLYQYDEQYLTEAEFNTKSVQQFTDTYTQPKPFTEFNSYADFNKSNYNNELSYSGENQADKNDFALDFDSVDSFDWMRYSGVNNYDFEPHLATFYKADTVYHGHSKYNRSIPENLPYKNGFYDDLLIKAKRKNGDYFYV